MDYHLLPSLINQLVLTNPNISEFVFGIGFNQVYLD